MILTNNADTAIACLLLTTEDLGCVLSFVLLWGILDRQSHCTRHVLVCLKLIIILREPKFTSENGWKFMLTSQYAKEDADMSSNALKCYAFPKLVYLHWFCTVFCFLALSSITDRKRKINSYPKETVWTLE